MDKKSEEKQKLAEMYSLLEENKKLKPRIDSLRDNLQYVIRNKIVKIMRQLSHIYADDYYLSIDREDARRWDEFPFDISYRYMEVSTRNNHYNTDSLRIEFLKEGEDGDDDEMRSYIISEDFFDDGYAEKIIKHFRQYCELQIQARKPIIAERRANEISRLEARLKKLKGEQKNE